MYFSIYNIFLYLPVMPDFQTKTPPQHGADLRFYCHSLTSIV